MTWGGGSAAGRSTAIVRPLIGAAGLGLFALCLHQPWPVIGLSVAGLLVAGMVIARAGRSSPANERAVTTGAFAAWCLAALAVGVAGGLAHRYSLGLPLVLASGLTSFVVVACLVGATEELVYRGWMLGELAVFGMPVAVVITAAAHAMYKALLFAWPPSPLDFDLPRLFLVTFGAGLVLGAMRAASGRVLPPALAHAAFDLVVYGGVGATPWWLW